MNDSSFENLNVSNEYSAVIHHLSSPLSKLNGENCSVDIQNSLN